MAAQVWNYRHPTWGKQLQALSACFFHGISSISLLWCQKRNLSPSIHNLPYHHPHEMKQMNLFTLYLCYFQFNSQHWENNQHNQFYPTRSSLHFGHETKPVGSSSKQLLFKCNNSNCQTHAQHTHVWCSVSQSICQHMPNQGTPLCLTSVVVLIGNCSTTTIKTTIATIIITNVQWHIYNQKDYFKDIIQDQHNQHTKEAYELFQS